ncbi:hypothetical protein AMTRI_Chr03g44870 [Amborella trichopoda]|uniref:Uncharacterized protein n=1 Tax=Amborella trichopoda TaxID=13333 RepID=W1PNX3_AMBTC|nr:uncharacterized protein LOC18439898 [Amborella trichopoda]XP_011625455.1 uncharacterized protein LOC18439898 [Amborella trichopoda]XP_011625456.1 uncharacterized protein LOC18439898 [Amborella trichopoda]XP_011625457.1 uncharacterized protein LOC18439898 [Amborella trichopoda]ERN11697.1 hypothetical protein AMTR_s00022p00226500 [Amborella trichopoda]|eukprot:XP_006850116.1 uncharacterized protein LOC18439898 [Amborella trichopoda]
MRMDRVHSSNRPESSNLASKGSSVVAIQCITGSSKAEEWDDNMLQTGDMVEEITIGPVSSVSAPFEGGKSGLQKVMGKAYKRGETSIEVRVRRGVAIQGCIVPGEGPVSKKNYMVRSLNDPNYAVGFMDISESECVALQGSRRVRVESALSEAQLQDGFVSYPWEKKMKEFLPIPHSSSFLSLLVLPNAPDRVSPRYNNLNDTLARAHAWLTASQASGVPIDFMNVQTEALLTKTSGEGVSTTVNTGSLADLSNMLNSGVYGFEDYHGLDIGIVRTVRLWYAPSAREFPIEIELMEGDTKLGFAISRTDEGFIHISSVANDVEQSVASRSGLSTLYKAAVASSKLLVISRVSDEKVLPWMVSFSGAVRCFDTISLSQKLSLHRHALKPILLHVFLWDGAPVIRPARRTVASGVLPLTQQIMAQMPEPQPLSLGSEQEYEGNDEEERLSREFSFRMSVGCEDKWL